MEAPFFRVLLNRNLLDLITHFQGGFKVTQLTYDEVVVRNWASLLDIVENPSSDREKAIKILSLGEASLEDRITNTEIPIEDFLKRINARIHPHFICCIFDTPISILELAAMRGFMLFIQKNLPTDTKLPFSLLSYISASGNKNLLKWYLQYWECDQKDISMAFNRAAWIGNLDMIQYFLESVVHKEKTKIYPGAVVGAAKYGHLEVVKFLTEWGLREDPTSIDLHATLNTALQFKQERVISYLSSFLPMNPFPTPTIMRHRAVKILSETDIEQIKSVQNFFQFKTSEHETFFQVTLEGKLVAGWVTFFGHDDMKPHEAELTHKITKWAQKFQSVEWVANVAQCVVDFLIHFFIFYHQYREWVSQQKNSGFCMRLNFSPNLKFRIFLDPCCM
jgi:hypothetical protein